MKTHTLPAQQNQPTQEESGAYRSTAIHLEELHRSLIERRHLELRRLPFGFYVAYVRRVMNLITGAIGALGVALALLAHFFWRGQLLPLLSVVWAVLLLSLLSSGRIAGLLFRRRLLALLDADGPLPDLSEALLRPLLYFGDLWPTLGFLGLALLSLLELSLQITWVPLLLCLLSLIETQKLFPFPEVSEEASAWVALWRLGRWMLVAWLLPVAALLPLWWGFPVLTPLAVFVGFAARRLKEARPTQPTSTLTTSETSLR